MIATLFGNCIAFNSLVFTPTRSYGFHHCSVTWQTPNTENRYIYSLCLDSWQVFVNAISTAACALGFRLSGEAFTIFSSLVTEQLVTWLPFR